MYTLYKNPYKTLRYKYYREPDYRTLVDMQLRSVSVENLENILKRTFNAALKDSSQITKFDQIIYKEWYFEKIMELRNMSDRIKSEKKEDTQKKISQETSLCSSSNLTKNISYEDNSTHEIEHLSRNLNTRIDNDESNNRDATIKCDKSVKRNVCDDNTEEICESSKTNEQQIISDSAVPDLEIVQSLNNPAQTTKIRKKLKKNVTEDRQNDGGKVQQLRRRLSFETWKKEKNLMYRKVLREAEEKKQWELQEKIREIERKKAFQEVYTQILREKEAQRKREIFTERLKMIYQIDILQRQIQERRVINDQAFDMWKRQKDMKSRGAKLII